jgi:LPS sulfotransferase NodH
VNLTRIGNASDYLSGLRIRHQVTRYVILFFGRDGSTYLSSLLESHPDIRQLYEQFGGMRKKGQGAKEQLDWARDFFTPSVIGRVGAVGFKTKIADVLDLEGFARLLREKRCHIIQMRRLNLVKAVVSRFTGRRLNEETGRWNLYKQEDRQPAMRVDPVEFDTYLKERESAYAYLETYVRQLDLPTLKIFYEDLMLDRDAVVRSVLAFLRVKPRALVGTTLKHTSDNLREAILNFNELRAHYRGSEYEAMFDEELAPVEA